MNETKTVAKIFFLIVVCLLYIHTSTYGQGLLFKTEAIKVQNAAVEGDTGLIINSCSAGQSVEAINFSSILDAERVSANSVSCGDGSSCDTGQKCCMSGASACGCCDASCTGCDCSAGKCTGCAGGTTTTTISGGGCPAGYPLACSDGVHCCPSGYPYACVSQGTCSQSYSSACNITCGSTTSTTIPCLFPFCCPLRKVLGDEAAELDQIRDFRDNSLVQSAVGRKIIELYYNNADSINAVLERSPVMQAVVRRAIKTIAPMVGKK